MSLIIPQVKAEELSTSIIAIGDLHADISSAKKVFQLAGIVDSEGNWTKENIIVVQTGDLMDRGPDGLELLQWMKQLERQAKKHNSQFYTLIGNHEAMNVMGDWRYVSPQDVQSFGGYEERKQALSVDGEWTKWIVEHPAVIDINGNIFVHGGVSIQYASPPETLSAEVQKALKSQKRAPILGSEGPLWYRGYWQNPEGIACAEVDMVLQKLQAKRMVMGHTTQRDGVVKSRCDGKLIAIDTGISAHYGSHLAAIQIDDDGIIAMYPSGTQQLIHEKVE